MVGDVLYVFELLRLFRGIGVFCVYVEERVICVLVCIVCLDVYDCCGDDDDGIF